MTRLMVDLKDFFLNYAEALPPSTIYECTVVKSYENGLLCLNFTCPGGVTFHQKAYELFRVVEKGDGTINILTVPTRLAM